jgi:hypothetical protein
VSFCSTDGGVVGSRMWKERRVVIPLFVYYTRTRQTKSVSAISAITHAWFAVVRSQWHRHGLLELDVARRPFTGCARDSPRSIALLGTRQMAGRRLDEAEQRARGSCRWLQVVATRLSPGAAQLIRRRGCSGGRGQAQGAGRSKGGPEKRAEDNEAAGGAEQQQQGQRRLPGMLADCCSGRGADAPRLLIDCCSSELTNQDIAKVGSAKKTLAAPGLAHLYPRSGKASCPGLPGLRFTTEARRQAPSAAAASRLQSGQRAGRGHVLSSCLVLSCPEQHSTAQHSTSQHNIHYRGRHCHGLLALSPDGVLLRTGAFI